MMSVFFRLVGEVVRIDANAMPADQSRPEFQKIPFGAGRVEYFGRIQSHFIEDDGELIHEGDIDIALRVFDHLGGFGDLNAGRFENARVNHRAVDGGQRFQRFGCIAGNDFHDFS